MQPDSPTPKIKVLKGLPLAIMGMGSRMFKLVETFCFLKAHFPEGRFSDVVAAGHTVAAASLISYKSFKRRLPGLEQEGFICKKNGCYYLSSWDDIAMRFDIRHQRFYHINQSNYVKLEYILRDKAEQEKKNQCARVCMKRIKSNRIVREVIESVTGPAIQAETVANHQLTNYLTEGRLYDQEQAFMLQTLYRNPDEGIIRGDDALSYRTLNQKFGFKGHGSYGYWKMKLQRLGIRWHEKRRLHIKPGTNTTLRSRRTRLGFIKWEEAENKLYLIMPDKTHHLPLKGLDERYMQLKEVIERLNNLGKQTA